MIMTLVHIELEKLFRRNRSYISIIAILVIVIVIQGGMMLDGESMINFISENLQEVFLLQGNLLNGYLISFLSINGLWIHVPILVVIVTGDLISGEANSGTLRIVLSRPVSRSAFILAKYIAAMIYVALLILILASLSLGLGVLFFGTGDIIVFFDKINVLPKEILLGRFIMAFAYGIISMWTVAALSFVFSCMSNNSLSPIILTMVVIILFTVISSIETGVFKAVQPYLFTTYMNNWLAFFDYQLEWQTIITSLVILTGHIIVFLVVTTVLFRKKDITS